MFKSIGSNWVVTVASIVMVYFLTPFTIHRLGDDGYGTWNLINAITGYLGLLVLGVPMASVRYFSQHIAKGDDRKLNEAIGSCSCRTRFSRHTTISSLAMSCGSGAWCCGSS